jgi:hypothetical protein
MKLPSPDSPIRDLFDVRDLAMWASPDARITAGSFRDTLIHARNWLARHDDIAFLHQFAYRANGDLWLVKITRKSWAKVWDFGH